MSIEQKTPPAKAQIADGLWLGGLAACKDHDGPTIHIWRGDNPKSTCAKKDRAGDLAIQYVDGYSLPDEILDALAVFVTRAKGDILIHCASGVTRAPTLAVAAMAVRSNGLKHPINCVGPVMEANYTWRRVVSNIYFKPLADIVRWYETRWTNSVTRAAIEHAATQVAVGDQGDAMVIGYIAAAERIEEEIGAPDGLCLDVGCNTGAGMEALSLRWPDSRWYGLEPVGRYAQIARERGFPVRTESAEDMGYEGGYFDFIFTRHNLEHIPDRAKAIAELHRILKPGGYLYVQAPIEPGGSPNKLHVSAFKSLDELRSAFPGFKELYWGPQETVAELILKKAMPGAEKTIADGSHDGNHTSPEDRLVRLGTHTADTAIAACGKEWTR